MYEHDKRVVRNEVTEGVRLGANLRILRRARKLTLGQVSRQADVALNVLNAYEKHQDLPNLYNLLKLAKYYHTSLDDLVFTRAKEGGYELLRGDARALDRVRASEDPLITVVDASLILGCDPNTLRVQANEDPAKLGFPLTIIGTRVKIPRLPFLAHLGYAEPPKEVEE